MKVSVILPTRNSVRYIEARIASIRAQTLRDFEVVVVDTQSTDGTLGRLLAWQAEDPRVTIHDVPPGLYQALNFGIRQAKGQYVYVATSDDTMRPDALERMAAALDAHPDCHVCDTLLEEIDSSGKPLAETDAGYLPCFGHLAYPRDRRHVRRTPYDFLLHCCGKTVYTSLTQILVRKAVFEKAGGFPEDWGPSADYLWGMRVALGCNVIFLPEKLATWRVHDSQLTGHDVTAKNFELMLAMGRRQIAELPQGRLREVAERLHRIVRLKTDLLPIKRHGSVKSIVCGLAHAVSRHPAWVVRLALAFACLRLRRQPCAAVRAYDALFRHVARNDLREYGKLIEPVENAPGS